MRTLCAQCLWEGELKDVKLREVPSTSRTGADYTNRIATCPKCGSQDLIMEQLNDRGNETSSTTK